VANTYVAPNFNCDTSTNVVGLTDVKGSAPVYTDNIYVYGTASGIPTLTVESVLTTKLIFLGQKSSGAANAGYRCANFVGNPDAGLTFGGGTDGTKCFNTQPASADASSKNISVVIAGTAGHLFIIRNVTGAPSATNDWNMWLIYGTIDIQYAYFKYFRYRAVDVYACSAYTNAASIIIKNCSFLHGDRVGECYALQIYWQGNYGIDIPLVLSGNYSSGTFCNLVIMTGDYLVSPAYIDMSDWFVDTSAYNDAEYITVQRLSFKGAAGAGAGLCYTRGNVWSTSDIRSSTHPDVYPAVGHVRASDVYGPSGTGYTGTETQAAANKVLAGSPTYGAGGTEFTPSLAIPAKPTLVIKSVADGTVTLTITGVVGTAYAYYRKGTAAAWSAKSESYKRTSDGDLAITLDDPWAYEYMAQNEDGVPSRIGQSDVLPLHATAPTLVSAVAGSSNVTVHVHGVIGKCYIQWRVTGGAFGALSETYKLTADGDIDIPLTTYVKHYFRAVNFYGGAYYASSQELTATPIDPAHTEYALDAAEAAKWAARFARSEHRCIFHSRGESSAAYDVDASPAVTETYEDTATLTCAAPRGLTTDVVAASAGKYATTDFSIYLLASDLATEGVTPKPGDKVTYLNTGDVFRVLTANLRYARCAWQIILRKVD
jgi:hypothetical protein